MNKNNKLVFEAEEMKKFVELSGLRQSAISEKTGIPKVSLCLILQGKRKCEAGEYATLCKALGVSMNKFLRSKALD